MNKNQLKDTFLTNPNLVKIKRMNTQLIENEKAFDSISTNKAIGFNNKNEQLFDKTRPQSKMIIKNKYEPIENENVRVHKALYNKILYLPPSETYYSRNYPIKPGVSFIKQLFDHDYSEKAIKKLKINIPETYWNNTEIIYVYNDPENNDELTMIKNKKDMHIFNTFLNIERKYYEKEFTAKENIQPFMVIRGPMSSPDSHETYASIERYETALDTSTNDNSHGIIQRYIRCKGKNRNLFKEESVKVETNSKYQYIREEVERERQRAKLEANPLPDINNTNNLTNTKKRSPFKNKKAEEKMKQWIKYIDKRDMEDKSKKEEREKFKSWIKPSIVRIDFKTRYNNSKNVSYLYLSY